METKPKQTQADICVDLLLANYPQRDVPDLTITELTKKFSEIGLTEKLFRKVLENLGASNYDAFPSIPRIMFVTRAVVREAQAEELKKAQTKKRLDSYGQREKIPEEVKQTIDKFKEGLPIEDFPMTMTKSKTCQLCLGTGLVYKFIELLNTKDGHLTGGITKACSCELGKQWVNTKLGRGMKSSVS